MVTEVAPELIVKSEKWGSSPSGFSEGSRLTQGSSIDGLGPRVGPLVSNILPTLSTDVSRGWAQSGEAWEGACWKREDAGAEELQDQELRAPLSLCNSRGNLMDTSLKRRQTRPRSALQPGALGCATPLSLSFPVCSKQQGWGEFFRLGMIYHTILCSVDTPSPTS